MVTVTASAPAKVILFGEHAVVYGKPALAGAIDRRVYVTARERSDRTVILRSEDMKTKEESLQLDGLGMVDTGVEFRYVKKALELAFDRAGSMTGIEIEIDSRVPPASGLGSSAAVSVSTLMAVLTLLGEEVSIGEVAKLGHNVELAVQGAASPTDTATSAFGGILFIQPGMDSEMDRYDRITVADLPLVVGYTGIERSTEVLVDSVRVLRQRFQEIVDPIISDIGRITGEAKRMFETGDREGIGQLMNINHGLLEALGVCNDRLSRLVYASRNAGARGAKLTGAGGGGCMIAYTPENQNDVADAITACRCDAFSAHISIEGVRVEKG